MSATTGAPPAWQQLRPWRNCNPGDLRPLANGQKWDGQIDVDIATGGPFCVFETRVYGWRALAKLLINYQVLDGCKTSNDICHRFAPPQDGNNTLRYTGTVCQRVGVAPSAVIDLAGNHGLLEDFCVGISIAEGGSRIPWPQHEIDAAMLMIAAEAKS